MKAILLAAGVGRRLGGAAEGKPKGLLEVGGRTLLDRLLVGLGTVGVPTAVVVVGHAREQIERALGTARGGVVVRCVYNPEFRKGPILSLWSARHELDDDVLIMDADVLCPTEMLARLLRSTHENCLLLDGRVASSGEEMMLMARNGRVLDIGRGAKSGYDTVGESVGFLKLSRAAVPTLLDAIETLLAAGHDTAEHEEAYPAVMARHMVGYARVDDLPWIEIDFPEDLARAEREILPQIVEIERR